MANNKIVVAIVALVLYIVCPSLHAQTGGRLVLVRADSARGFLDQGRVVRELIGGVEFQQDSSHMYCQKARQYVDEGYVHFTGAVRIVSPPRQLLADEIFHYEQRREQIARGHARLMDRVRTLDAQSLHYFEIADRALADGKALLQDHEERVTLRGQRIEYLRGKGYASIEGRPVFVRQDSSAKDSLVIRSRIMEMLDDGKRIQARDSVTMVQGSTSAQCGLLRYLREEEKITLVEQPQAQRDEDRMRGIEIDLYMKERTLTGIEMRGQAMVLTRVDTLLSPDLMHDFLSGEQIYVGVKNNQVDSVYVKDRATSYYHLFEDKKYKGINKVLGDELGMSFRDGKVHRVAVTSSPAASNGIFFPRSQQVALAKELDALLEQFRSGVIAPQQPRQKDVGPVDDERTSTKMRKPGQNIR